MDIRGREVGWRGVCSRPSRGTHTDSSSRTSAPVVGPIHPVDGRGCGREGKGGVGWESVKRRRMVGGVKIGEMEERLWGGGVKIGRHGGEIVAT